MRASRTGWFSVNGVQPGTRTLAYQIKGLGILQREAAGRTVLDLGCAEGLVSQWLCDSGAIRADGIDYSQSRLAVGRTLVSDSVRLHLGDLSEVSCLPALAPSYDIVLLLAVLHKMAYPERLLDHAMAKCGSWLAVRAPAPVIEDRCNRRLDIAAHLNTHGFRTVQESDGHPDDVNVVDPKRSAWLGIFSW